MKRPRPKGVATVVSAAMTDVGQIRDALGSDVSKQQPAKNVPPLKIEYLAEWKMITTDRFSETDLFANASLSSGN
jgi:hypothetical protein